MSSSDTESDHSPRSAAAGAQGRTGHEAAPILLPQLPLKRGPSKQDILAGFLVLKQLQEQLQQQGYTLAEDWPLSTHVEEHRFLGKIGNPEGARLSQTSGPTSGGPRPLPVDGHPGCYLGREYNNRCCETEDVHTFKARDCESRQHRCSNVTKYYALFTAQAAQALLQQEAQEAAAVAAALAAATADPAHQAAAAVAQAVAEADPDLSARFKPLVFVNDPARYKEVAGMTLYRRKVGVALFVEDVPTPYQKSPSTSGSVGQKRAAAGQPPRQQVAKRQAAAVGPAAVPLAAMAQPMGAVYDRGAGLTLAQRGRAWSDPLPGSDVYHHGHLQPFHHAAAPQLEPALDPEAALQMLLNQLPPEIQQLQVPPRLLDQGQLLALLQGPQGQPLHDQARAQPQAQPTDSHATPPEHADHHAPLLPPLPDVPQASTSMFSHLLNAFIRPATPGGEVISPVSGDHADGPTDPYHLPAFHPQAEVLGSGSGVQAPPAGVDTGQMQVVGMVAGNIAQALLPSAAGPSRVPVALPVQRAVRTLPSTSLATPWNNIHVRAPAQSPVQATALAQQGQQQQLLQQHPVPAPPQSQQLPSAAQLQPQLTVPARGQSQPAAAGGTVQQEASVQGQDAGGQLAVVIAPPSQVPDIRAITEMVLSHDVHAFDNVVQQIQAIKQRDSHVCWELLSRLQEGAVDQRPLPQLLLTPTKRLRKRMEDSMQYYESDHEGLRESGAPQLHMLRRMLELWGADLVMWTFSGMVNGPSQSTALHTAIRHRKTRECGMDMIRLILEHSEVSALLQTTQGCYAALQEAARCNDQEAAEAVLDKLLKEFARKGLPPASVQDAVYALGGYFERANGRQILEAVAQPWGLKVLDPDDKKGARRAACARALFQRYLAVGQSPVPVTAASVQVHE